MSATPDGGDFRGLALIGTAVAEMVAPILFGVWLDGRNGWSPWGLVVGAVLGVGGSVAHLVMISRKS